MMPTGPHFFCMRRTLATYDHASNCWKNTPDNAVPCPSSGFAQAFANLVREACLIRALFSLGLAQPLLDLEKLLKLLDSYVLVAVGPFASQFWRQESLAGEANPHKASVHFVMSHEFCLYATCEHMHAAFLILGQLSLQRPVFPERSKPVPLFEQVLLPAALGGLSARGQARSDPLDLPRENANLTAFLRAHNWILWNPPLQQQQMTVQQLSSLTFADLRLAAPTVPSGVLLQIQSAACEWMCIVRPRPWNLSSTKSVPQVTRLFFHVCFVLPLPFHACCLSFFMPVACLASTEVQAVIPDVWLAALLLIFPWLPDPILLFCLPCLH